MVSSPKELLGKSIGRHRLNKLIGMGGTGAVFLGSNEDGNQAAIKVLFPPFLADPEAIEEAHKRFQREVKILSQLDHPHILPIRAFGKDAATGFPYMVMPYKSGGTLAEQIKAGPLSFEKVLRYVQQIAQALDYAHTHNIIHRDIKPANVLLDEEDEIFLADFNIAKIFDQTITTLTNTHHMLGTPAYMAPEQIMNKTVSPATDVYGLAVLTYQLITGRLPFDNSALLALLQHIMQDPVPSPHDIRSTFPLSASNVLLQALAKEPEARFASAGAFTEALEQGLQDSLVTLASTKIELVEDQQKSIDQINGQAQAPEADQLSPVDAATYSTLPSTDIVEHVAVSEPLTPAHLPMLQSSDLSDQVDKTQATLIKTPPPFITKQRWVSWKVAAVVMLVFLLVSGSMYGYATSFAFMAPGGIANSGMHPQSKSNQGKPTVAPTATAAPTQQSPASGAQTQQSPATAATVVLTPDSQMLEKTFTVSAVTGVPNTSQHQVQARLVFATTTQSHTVNATGQQTTPATNASGTLLFTNLSYTAGYRSNVGDVMASTSGTGVGAVLDEAVNLPAAATNCSNTGTCPQQRVHAHSAITGSKGNTLYHFDYGSCSPSSNSCYSATDDTPFTGGAGAQSYTFVQQSDIDGATQALQQASAPNAQQVLQGQLKANESWIGTQACKPQKTAANHVANDKAANVTVTITLTCTGEVYDQNGALASAKQMLQDQAASNPGNNYALAGAINATLLNAQLAGTNGTVGVTVDVKGTWIFQLSAAQKQDLARMLAGKKKVAAVDLLQQQKGIKQAQIQLTGGDQDTLPDNPQVIAITIQPGA